MARSARTLGWRSRALLIAACLGALPAWSAAGLAAPRARATSPTQAALLNLTASGSQSPRVVQPGETNVNVFTLLISNSNLGSSRLNDAKFKNLTTGTGSKAQLDAELGTPRLYVDDGDGVFEPAQDVLAGTSTPSGGVVRFSGISVSVPALGSTRLYVALDVPLTAKDADGLDLSVNGAGDLSFDSGGSPTNAFPINPAGVFTVDGLVAAQLALAPVGPGNVLAGAARQLMLSVRLGANGYTPDQLQGLTIYNDGTATAGGDLTDMSIWADNGDNVFSAGADRRIGSLVFTGDRWQLGGLTETLPVAGVRMFFTVDVSDFAEEGHTIRLVLPSSPVQGLNVQSGNDGPIDRPVGNPYSMAISTSDRVTFTAAEIAGTVVHPGDPDVPLLHLVATSSYTTPRMLTSLTFRDATVGGGDQDDRDREMSVLTLRADGDGDGVLDDPTTDPVIGSASFVNGVAAFSGLQWTLAGGQTGHLFLTASVALHDAADGDALSATVEAPGDLAFSTSTHVAASWPLDSGARAKIDGMLAAQLSNLGAPSGSHSASSPPVLALAVIVPRNGYADDVITGLRLVNLGTATDTDLADVHWWRDGGDGVFSAGGGDDVDLGPATFAAGEWHSGALAAALGASGARLFASIATSAVPTDSSSIRLAIPIDGIEVQSGNDGPLDHALANPGVLTISNAPLLASLTLAPDSSSVGQDIQVQMVVKNAGAEAVLGVTPGALTPAGTGALTLISGPSPPTFGLPPAAADTFRWVYRAATAGDVTLSGDATGTGSPSGQARRALPAASAAHHVFDPAARMDYALEQSMPPLVTRGQHDVVPMRLTFAHVGGPASAPARLTALRIRIEDETGAGIVPSNLLTQVSVNAGTAFYVRKTAIESTGAEVALQFDTPLLVGDGQSPTVTLRLDLSAATTVQSFRVAILDSTWVTADDANLHTAVPVDLTSGGYPARSDLTRLLAAATRLDVDLVPGSAARVGRGQQHVPLLTLRVLNPGVDGITSNVRVATFALQLTDTSGVPLARIADVLSRVRVSTPLQSLASQPITYADSGVLVVTLNPPLGVPVNTPIDVAIEGDIAAQALTGTFLTLLGDSARFDARDDNSRDPVRVVYAATPILGPRVAVETLADTLEVSGTPAMPLHVGIGAGGILAMRATFRHPDAFGAARLRVDTLIVQCRDEARRPVVPATVLSRLHVRWNGVVIASVTDPPAVGGVITVALPAPLIEPSDSATVEILVDIAASAPSGFVELMVFGVGVRASDANLGQPVQIVAAAGAELPMVSGLTHIDPPARDLTVDLASRMPVTLARDGATLVVGELKLTNAAPAGADSLHIRALTFAAADRTFVPLNVGAGASLVQAWVGSSLWAETAALTVDSTLARLTGAGPLAVAAGESLVVELRIVTATGTGPETFRLGCYEADIGVIQPASALLQVRVSPTPGEVFPLWTDAGTFGAASLRESYSNFPNPFAAGRQLTSFVYYLPVAANVTLRLFTADGQDVATLAENASRPAGINQSDHWDGRNGAGQVVRNGVYFAELKADFSDGTRARVMRKVAVVR